MDNLETLLNKLIEMGWKPWGQDLDTEIVENNYKIEFETTDGIRDFSMNDLCSIESGLWQFVVEKNLTKGPLSYFEITKEWSNGLTKKYVASNGDTSGKYYVMLSSIQEDKTNFILDNITINE